MAGLLARMARVKTPPLHAMTPAEARAAYTLRAEVLDPPRAPLARVEDFTIPAADGTPLPARLYAPSHERLPLLLYLHGGGFVIGNLGTHDSLCRQLALRSGGAVVALDYRLAPEHRFPTAVDDAWAAMHWLAAQAHMLGLDASRLAVGGDSAGGTLAAVCALHARDRGLALALQLLITPGTTAHADTASHKLFANGFVLDAAAIAWFFDHYIEHHHRRDWRFAPLEADVDGVAPACVILAECDPLVDEGVAYADQLRAAGVPVELELYRGLTHDFIKMGRAIPEAKLAQQVAAEALRQAWES
ncbi:alpha/beta hydrolase [Azohydromonas caseinilytica]|uniref:Alpha/beta hydrolase n=1 Tax=Azohydromonas caseinilytica TaxID=2728836 RepID=A0A848FEC8_9BURK|nr:alpha/beta hydrolase [Azohydromonas caseinilytica]NML17406.1 alpha/beta hydrolase [Azohydromonas caseinilytica]